MKPGKSPIGGRQITRKEALKGLGDPKTWPKYAARVYAEFRAKPQRKGTTDILTRAVEKVTKALRTRSGSVSPAPVFATGLGKRKAAKGKGAKKKPRRRKRR